jgi:putative toxin-antitoxin system antitoxin component (TIGR02293 family)
MLANYDALAIAELMGIAFLRSIGGPRPAARKARAGAADFTITVDGGAVRVAEARRTAGARAGATLSPPSPALIEKAVEKGLPRDALRHVAEHLAGGDAARVHALEWTIVPRTTLERREKQLSPQESERTERVARLFVQARRALGSDEEAREFMTAPHPGLDGRSPIDAASTDFGTRRTEQILNALEYGLAL